MGALCTRGQCQRRGRALPGELGRSPAAAHPPPSSRAHPLPSAPSPVPAPAPTPAHSRPVALALAPSPLHCTEQASHALGFVRHGRSGSFLAAQQRPPLPARLAGVVPPLQPGDVLLFTDLTLHRSGPNTTPLARWSADWAYELRATDAICPPIEPPAPPAEVGTAPAEVATAGTAGLILTVTAGAAGAAGLTLTVTASAEVAPSRARSERPSHFDRGRGLLGGAATKAMRLCV